MTRLVWGRPGEKYYQAGVDRGVLYVGASPGVPWNGLTNVEEAPSGGEPRAFYIDGEKYLNISAREEFNATITAFMYPPKFEECDGSAQARPGLFLFQQRRKSFGFSYRTGIGNDTDGSSHGYKLHIVYNALVGPASVSTTTLGDSPEPTTFSWSLTTKPPKISGYKNTAHIAIDSRYTHPITMATIEDILYGTPSTAPNLPTFAELLAIFDELIDLVVTDNEDGTADIAGPDEAFVELSDGKYSITWDSVEPVDDDSYSISS